MELPEPRDAQAGVTVSVVIPVFNQAHFLGEAISSVLAQTRQADDIVVIDDGSTDDPASVTATFPGIRLIQQKNRGLAAARNRGLQSVNTSHIVFLDSDDRLLPTALETGLICIANHTDCAFVFGGFRLISENGTPLGPDRFSPIEGNAHLSLIRRNLLGPPTTGLYRRDCLLAMNGFDETLRRAEDYDLFLRIAQKYPIASHPNIVAEYRRHGQNMTNNHSAQLKAVLHVLDLHETRIIGNAETRKAFEEGRKSRRVHYVSQMLEAASIRWREKRNIGELTKRIIQAARWSPLTTARALIRALGRRFIKALPYRLERSIQQFRHRPYAIPRGLVQFGDLRRLSPFDTGSGWNRGTPVDRYYIERFLAQNAVDIRGRVLELADDSYTRRFGGDQVTQSDILAVEATNEKATIVCDISQSNCLDEKVFDCIIFTQALQYIYDLDAAIGSLYQALKPGGVLLVTAPGITKMHEKHWPWYWAFTAPSIRRLLGDWFGPGFVKTEVHGNVFAATVFLYGLALEELDIADLNIDDENYPVIISARAIKAKTK